WQRGFGRQDAEPIDGDANGDRLVDVADLLQWQSQFGGTSPSPDAAVAAVQGTDSTALAGLAKLMAKTSTPESLASHDQSRPATSPDLRAGAVDQAFAANSLASSSAPTARKPIHRGGVGRRSTFASWDCLATEALADLDKTLFRNEL
ncbi:MAG: hypothetical protein KDA61_00700, partial [Planctomycetales bacterium]|nr:hypothetical protein [Planctomycetales bacterium]